MGEPLVSQFFFLERYFMKKILFVSAPVLALISQNAFAEEAKKDILSFYGSVHAYGDVYSSQRKNSRDNLDFSFAEVRPGVKATWGKLSLDLQFQLEETLMDGVGGKDWDIPANDITITAGTTPSADNLYKAIWNQPLRKAFVQYKTENGTTVKAGLIRPQIADCVGFYFCGTTGFGNSLGASVGQDFDFGIVKGTATLSMVDKVSKVPFTTDTDPDTAGDQSNEITPNGKSFHYAVKGKAADMVDFVLAYGNNYKDGDDQSRFEASAIYNADAYSVGAYMERTGEYYDEKNYGNATRVAVDAAYNVNENIQAVAGYSITTEGGKIADKDVEYPKALNVVTVGPRYIKDGAFAELALSYAMQSASSKDAEGKDVKPFKNSKGEAGKETSAMAALVSVGVEW
jgi:hypothetical protein